MDRIVSRAARNDDAEQPRAEGDQTAGRLIFAIRFPRKCRWSCGGTHDRITCRWRPSFTPSILPVVVFEREIMPQRPWICLSSVGLLMLGALPAFSHETAAAQSAGKPSRSRNGPRRTKAGPGLRKPSRQGPRRATSARSFPGGSTAGGSPLDARRLLLEGAIPYRHPDADRETVR